MLTPRPTMGDLGLTPESLESATNIATAHARGCNTQCEFDVLGRMAKLRARGVKELPKYLRRQYKERRGEISSETNPLARPRLSPERFRLSNRISFAPRHVGVPPACSTCAAALWRRRPVR